MEKESTKCIAVNLPHPYLIHRLCSLQVADWASFRFVIIHLCRSNHLHPPPDVALHKEHLPDLQGITAVPLRSLVQLGPACLLVTLRKRQ